MARQSVPNRSSENVIRDTPHRRGIFARMLKHGPTDSGGFDDPALLPAHCGAEHEAASQSGVYGWRIPVRPYLFNLPETTAVSLYPLGWEGSDSLLRVPAT